MVDRVGLLLALLFAGAPEAAAERLVGRTRVVDGDTIVVAGVTVRLKGIAAPEIAHAGDLGERGGIEAAEFMRELAEGRTVVCELTRERTHGDRPGSIAGHRHPGRWLGRFIAGGPSCLWAWPVSPLDHVKITPPGIELARGRHAGDRGRGRWGLAATWAPRP